MVGVIQLKMYLVSQQSSLVATWRQCRSLNWCFVIKSYRIALNFLGSKFLWIAIFEDFAGIISQISLHTRHPRNIQQAWPHTVVSLNSQLSAKQCLLQRYLLAESSLLIRQPCPRMLAIDTLAVRPWNFVTRQNFSLKIFSWMVENSQN